jgi:hypothetical protein
MTNLAKSRTTSLPSLPYNQIVFGQVAVRKDALLILRRSSSPIRFFSSFTGAPFQ